MANIMVYDISEVKSPKLISSVSLPTELERAGVIFTKNKKVVIYNDRSVSIYDISDKNSFIFLSVIELPLEKYAMKDPMPRLGLDLSCPGSGLENFVPGQSRDKKIKT